MEKCIGMLSSKTQKFEDENTVKLNNRFKVAVIIPSYKVKEKIMDVLAGIGRGVDRIYVVDDLCPQASGLWVSNNCNDPRVMVLYNHANLGVGGTVLVGYRAAILEGMDILVKIDGDGQMDPSLIDHFIDPIIDGFADYTKGNRFYNLENLRGMPKLRLFGNAVLSLMCKISSGYWNLFDPTNGYTAIHADVARLLPFAKISQRYFFETDMLFRLNTIQAVVVDIPMVSKYEGEVSNLKISKVTIEFFIKHARNFFKRIFYNYYLRDMSIASIELPLGILLFSFGVIYGGFQWFSSATVGIPKTAGTVMLSGLPVTLGLQLILAFFGYDILTVPKHPIHQKISFHESGKGN